MTRCRACRQEVPAQSTTCPHCQAAIRPLPWWRLPITNFQIVMFAAVCVVLQVVSFVMISSEKKRQTRESYRDYSQKNLQQIGTALQHYHAQFGRLPLSQTVDEQGHRAHSWQTLLLPYVTPDWSEDTTSRQIDFGRAWNDPQNLKLLCDEMPWYRNPELYEYGSSGKTGISHYAANSRVLSEEVAFSLDEVSDGLSQTLMAGEVNAGFKAWGDPTNHRDPTLGFNTGPDSFGSPYPGGVNMLLMDGSVRFLSDKLDRAILKALATPNGGETVGEF